MKQVLSFFLVLLIFVTQTTGIVAVSVMEQEKAEVRNLFEQMLREMATVGYLDPAVASYYEQKLKSLGYQQSTPYFIASHTSPDQRAIRSIRGESGDDNQVTLTVEVQPSAGVRVISILRTGDARFRFTGTRPSEYMPEGGEGP